MASRHTKIVIAQRIGRKILDALDWDGDIQISGNSIAVTRQDCVPLVMICLTERGSPTAQDLLLERDFLALGHRVLYCRSKVTALLALSQYGFLRPDELWSEQPSKDDQVREDQGKDKQVKDDTGENSGHCPSLTVFDRLADRIGMAWAGRERRFCEIYGRMADEQ
jgi:hypothetical protein